ncbi:MAG: 23S rRNA (adenine(2503)-C(2))-methyltransferase RlmN [Deltaproteobacteria bacterium]|jgi:23S rRNA (adenine2503-C2)-methyltransferase|nr:23S rRNA (adenine(2503)-C(2))-methyltransferase RlmN [Deltaproteobacteria bacterium]
MNTLDITNFSLPQLTELLVSLGLPKYRAIQIFAWLYRPHISSFSQMTDLPKELRNTLADEIVFEWPQIAAVERSKDGTAKYGFKLKDDRFIEAVLIPEETRSTLCVSSQVGCAMGCEFCLTGSLGFKRNLTPGEIVGQVVKVRDWILDMDESIPGLNNLVFMGMGEPLANFDNLLVALDILTEQRGLDFSERRITVSTCGLVHKIIELGEKTKVNLAVSLHSVNDAVRSQLMPINRTYPVAKLLEACRKFPMPKRKRIMFEYVLIKDINDSVADAEMLAEKLKGIPCKINLLPFNESKEVVFRKPSDEQIELFQKTLWNAGYTVLVRSSRGADISAACGQLAGKKSL